ncbi:hypothetical protein HC026_11165 [Lactobacillus sp. LC28-10]|uniref:Uncharacterized protein n=1 Tax=Secundilactobacillus angelensis TaxID=2722706 RepID=A0ABX1KZU0_9LACO|nr:hypothetical protein [Secundilactobacillus angelensis]MCH5463189.1 hypothetical protein [Secundilactobacillus angelensis]NLR19452.1 hypothetical protein [Secundilactobacillus angelensis]
MWRNFKLNHFIVISGLETLTLGAYLIYVQHVFNPYRPAELAHIIQHAQDPGMAIILVCVGMLAIITGCWDINRFKAKRLSIVSMAAIWSTYFVAFFYHDCQRPGPIGFGTFLIAFILIRLLAEALWGERT